MNNNTPELFFIFAVLVAIALTEVITAKHIIKQAAATERIAVAVEMMAKQDATTSSDVVWRGEEKE